MLSYRIDPVAGIVYVEGEQGHGMEEFSALLVAVLEDPAYRPGFGFLRDRRGMPPLETPLLRSNLAALERIFGSVPSRWAFVANDPANYGMTRMAAFLLESARSGELAVFEDLDEAVRWLRRQPPPRPPEQP